MSADPTLADDLALLRRYAEQACPYPSAQAVAESLGRVEDALSGRAQMERDEARTVRARAVVDAIPPREWNVWVWPEHKHYERGRLDGADQLRLVRLVLAEVEP